MWVRIETMTKDAAERLTDGRSAFAGPSVLKGWRYPVEMINRDGEVAVTDMRGESCCVGMLSGEECKTHPGVTCTPVAPPKGEDLFTQSRWA